MNPPAAALRIRLWRFGAWLGAAAMLLALLLLAPYMTRSTELVRLRNALLVADDLASDFDWRPPAVPPGYLQESAPPDPAFVQVAAQLKLAELPDDWARALAISRHLLGSQPHLDGGALMSDLRGTYGGIVQRGSGYCADFVRAFNAVAGAAGMTVRSWAFSFDGFGGHGHVWPEIWNRQAQRWQLLDVFDNYYFVLDDGEPLSALALRGALLGNDARLKLIPLHPGARPGYVIEAKAWTYLRNGLPQWYLWWGANPFSYDRAPAVRALAGHSRAGEQLAAIAVGVHPAIRILPEPGNAAERRHMRTLLTTMQASVVLVVCGMALLAVSLAMLRRQVKQRVAHAAT
ncbi:MAG: transglutaminase domain-containing protein [Burkholderiales bacterium]|nr:transglutaminase domain-containing protein [Burkholderiales bacterium]